MFALLFGLDQGANVSWRSPITITPLCATLPLLIAFLWVEARFASAPFTPGHIIFDRALVACYATNFFGYAGFTALIFYLPMFFQVVINMTPAQAGAGLIPAAISAVVGTLLGGIILKRIGRFYWLALVASSVGALAAIPIAVAPSLHKGALVTIYVASIASFVPQGITVTSSLIAISKFRDLLINNTADRILSIKRLSRRSSCSNRMLLPVPISRCSCWGFYSRFGHSRGPSH